jgi:hypothetical protein
MREEMLFKQIQPKGQVVQTDQGMVVVDPRTGTSLPVTLGGEPVGQVKKPLPSQVITQLQESRDNATTIKNLLTAFKDDFANKGLLGLGAEMQLTGSARIGVDKDAVEWWKNYKKQAELVERHAMFGASLTANEQNSWRSADIDPGMDKDVIKKNLATRERLTKKLAENTRQDFIDAGYDQKKVDAIAGRGSSGGKDGGDSKVLPNKNQKGWTLHTDAKGNKAYISPDGKSFEEVK